MAAGRGTGKRRTGRVVGKFGTSTTKAQVRVLGWLTTITGSARHRLLAWHSLGGQEMQHGTHVSKPVKQPGKETWAQLGNEYDTALG